MKIIPYGLGFWKLLLNEDNFKIKLKDSIKILKRN